MKAVAAALAAVVAASVATAAPPPWVDLSSKSCVTKANRGAVIGLRASDGTRLAALALGRRGSGVVLVHGARSDFCEWFAYATALSRTHRVLLVDLRGYGSSYEGATPATYLRYELDVAAAAAELRRRGAKRVLAIGSSLGAGVVLIAGAAPKAGLAGVVALSPAFAADSEYDTRAAARALRTPVLYLAASGDGAFAADARRLYRLTQGKAKELLVVRGSAHGSSMLGERAPLAAVTRFLAKHG